MSCPFTLPPVAELLPHAAPMILLDSVCHADAGGLQALVTITAGSRFNQGDGVGAWIGIEYMAQTIAAWAGLQARRRARPVRLGLLLGTRRYRCAVSTFTNGMRLKVTAQVLLEGGNGVGAFDCAIVDTRDDQTLAHATLSVFQPHDVNHYFQESMS